jgi:SAM-dependent MidA family methyltransferase
MSVVDEVMAMVRRHGPVPVDVVVDRALYAPEVGFYEAGGEAGRRGHFLTSPEVGPLFGIAVARALDGSWEEMGRPDPFVVVDAGAGRGTLCRSVLAAQPACAPALRYVLVERSRALRRRHRDRLRLEEPALAFAPVDPETEEPVAEAPTGPICVSLPELPRVPGPVVVVANELIDNLPFGLAERRGGAWSEVRVIAADRAQPNRDRHPLVECRVPLDVERATLLDRLAPSAPDGARVPLQDAARRWLSDALDLASPGGRVVVLDYASTTAALAERPADDWLRTYREHTRGGHYLEDLGTQDITCEVAVDQLALVRGATRDRSQAEWLHSLGLDELVAEGRRLWSERAHIGDLAALTARSRVREAEALTDPAGLGAFRVVEWQV